jgi:23S rRNA pseudouridine2605 synthase
MPRKATSKSKKKTEAENPELPAAEELRPQPEPDEPELHAAVQASLDEEPGLQEKAPRVTPEPVAEALAEAADTFEQAFEERRPPQRPELIIEADPAGSEQEDAGGESDEDDAESPDAEEESEVEPRPAHMERLQKILSQAGIASRRHAEEMITEGRVQVNGKVVTELGSKADAERDHIRVDGKLIRGAERLRYFVLNKPRGYVTTVSDPEGRPTVMEFFKKAGERLYPVGRLDYHSEGLLLVTNDGDLANKLTKAATGVEKTYLVKVSGQPTEEELDRLREGIAIDRGRAGEGRVQTAPATIQEARQGDNPWYEVVLTEGRNRELRKMFEEIGNHVEKIRRVGYGPLILDVEPGQFRELDPQELDKLRLGAEG